MKILNAISILFLNKPVIYFPVSFQTKNEKTPKMSQKAQNRGDFFLNYEKKNKNFRDYPGNRLYFSSKEGLTLVIKSVNTLLTKLNTMVVALQEEDRPTNYISLLTKLNENGIFSDFIKNYKKEVANKMKSEDKAMISKYHTL